MDLSCAVRLQEVEEHGQVMNKIAQR